MPLSERIYLNQSRVLFRREEDLTELERNQTELIWRPASISDVDWDAVIDFLESLKGSHNAIFVSPKPKGLRKAFFDRFELIEAAGGLVINERGEILFIIRHGKWDLPKGHIEDGESKRIAAIREIYEETGLTTLHLQHKIGCTFHTYKNKVRKRILKKSHWYFCTAPTMYLEPQEEEGIQQALWRRPELCHLESYGIYRNIQDVIEQGYPFGG